MHDADPVAAAQRLKGLNEAERVRDAAVEARKPRDEQNQVGHLALGDVRRLDGTLREVLHQPRHHEEDLPRDDWEDEREDEVEEPDEAVVVRLPRLERVVLRRDVVRVEVDVVHHVGRVRPFVAAEAHRTEQSRGHGSDAGVCAIRQRNPR